MTDQIQEVNGKVDINIRLEEEEMQVKLLKSKRLPLDFIYKLVPFLEKKFFSPNDSVCVEDYVCENAYLLYEGVANLYVHDLAIRRLTVGDFFWT